MTPIEFFELIYKHVPDPDKVYVAWGAVDRPAFLTVATVLGIVQSGIPQDKNVYYTPAVMREKKRTKDVCVGAGVVWADRDVYKDFDTSPLLPPTVVVKSGRGEHLYWILDNFYAAGDIEDANHKVHNHLSISGEGCFDRVRFLRVPGSNNCKYLDQEKNPDYKEPLPCEVVNYNPDAVYSLDDLRRLQPYKNDLLVMPKKRGKPEEIDRHRRDFKLARTLLEWGISEYAVKLSLLEYSSKAEEREEKEGSDAGYIQGTLDKAKQGLIAEGEEGDASRTIKVTKAVERLANVDMTPVGKLVDPQEHEAGLMIRLSWQDEVLYSAATGQDFSSATKVINWLAQTGPNRTFMGSDKQAKLEWERMVQSCPKKRVLQVPHAGRYDLKNGQVCFIYGRNDALVYPLTPPEEGGLEGVFWKADIRLPNYLELAGPDEVLNPQEATHVLGLILASQKPEVILPALGWFLMTPFKTLIEADGIKMPALLLYGFPGSGKSSLIEKALMPLLGRFTTAIASTSSRFSLIGGMTLTQSWPVWFGEFRASNYNVVEFQTMLREAFDRQFHTRGNPDRSIDQYNLVSPPVIDGENPFVDGANQERAIMLQLDKNTIDLGTPQQVAFQELLLVSKDFFKRFARAYLEWTLTKRVDYIRGCVDAAKIELAELQTNRILNSYAITRAGLDILNDFCRVTGIGIEVKPDLEAFRGAYGKTYTTGLGVRALVDGVVEQISHGQEDADAEWDGEAGILYFNLVRALRGLHLNLDPSLLAIQLEQRRASYITGPFQREEGGRWWGVDIAKALELNLDVSKPRALLKRATFSLNGRGERI